jgi:carbon storage regulator
MLVISRSVGQRIFVGEEIVVTILEVAGSSVRVGIDAPREVAVYREEIRPDDLDTKPSPVNDE